MKKLLKLLSITVAFSMAFCTLSTFALSESTEDASTLIKELKIMNGDENGDLHLDNFVTRAEFSKIAVKASSYRNMVASNLSISSFKDVPYYEWYAPYVYLASKNKLINGYPDSTFKPNDYVTYEEAVTVCLKLLGYTDDDFGISWPYGQIGMAENLDLNKNLYASQGEYLTREKVLLLIYNLLNTDKKGTNVDFITTFDYNILEDVILIATSNEDTSVGSGKINTSKGSFKIPSDFNYDNVGKKGDMVIKNNDELVSFVPVKQNVETYNIYQVLDSNLMVIKDGVMESLDIDDNLTVYNKSTPTMLKAVYGQLTPGDILVTYKNENNVLDYGVIKTDEMQGPNTYKSQNQISEYGLNSPIVIKDGKKTDVSGLCANDIIYYSNTLNTVWAYSTRVSGIYESAEPNKDTPNSVTVSGVKYAIEGSEAFKKLSSNSDLPYGSSVTLLLGKDGKIADVIEKSSSVKESSNVVTGYLIGSGTKEMEKTNGEKYSALYVSIVDADGKERQYTTDKDYSDYKNRVVKLTINANTATANFVLNNNLTGKVNAENMTIGKEPVASDVKIIDIGSTDRNYVSAYKRVYMNRIDGINFSSESVISYNKNIKGEIDELFLNNVTGDSIKYGLSTSDRGATYDILGTKYAQNGKVRFTVKDKEPVAILSNGVSASYMKALTKLSSDIISVNEEYIESKSGQKTLLSQDVSVYVRNKDGDYLYLPISSLVEQYKKYTMWGYIDKSISAGGRVRVIMAFEK